MKKFIIIICCFVSLSASEEYTPKEYKSPQEKIMEKAEKLRMKHSLSIVGLTDTLEEQNKNIKDLEGNIDKFFNGFDFVLEKIKISIQKCQKKLDNLENKNSDSEKTTIDEIVEEHSNTNQRLNNVKNEIKEFDQLLMKQQEKQ